MAGAAKRCERNASKAGVEPSGCLNELTHGVYDLAFVANVDPPCLDSGAMLRSSMANTARLDTDAYSVSQRVVASFSVDDCVVLER